MDRRSRLMRRRVRTMLLLGSRYDEFILKEAGFVGVGEEPPEELGVQAQCMLARDGDHAVEAVQRGGVDLVLSSLKLRRDDPFELIGKLRMVSPHLPAVLLTSRPRYHGPLSQGASYGPFDYVFAWQGRTELLRAIVMMIEDRLNADHDLLVGGVQLILLVEDEPGLYSQYLPTLYDEICHHVRDLTPESASAEERARRVQARTKVLLAHTYEEALLLLARYGDAVCGVLSDLQYPRDGRIDSSAGLHLARHVRYVRSSIPVVIQSRERSVEGQAHEAGAFFIWKNSDHLLRQLRGIMMDYFGFGDFIFRSPATGGEVGRAADLEDLGRLIRDVPLEVFRYHGSRDHFSTWLYIHGDHELARALRSMRSTEESTRACVVRLIADALGDRSKALE